MNAEFAEVLNLVCRKEEEAGTYKSKKKKPEGVMQVI